MARLKNFQQKSRRAAVDYHGKKIDSMLAILVMAQLKCARSFKYRNLFVII